MPWSLKPKSNASSLGSIGRCTVSIAWLSSAVLARSPNNWPKLMPSEGPRELKVMPPSTWPPMENVSHHDAGLAGSDGAAAGGVWAWAAPATMKAPAINAAPASAIERNIRNPLFDASPRLGRMNANAGYEIHAVGELAPYKTYRG